MNNLHCLKEFTLVKKKNISQSKLPWLLCITTIVLHEPLTFSLILLVWMNKGWILGTSEINDLNSSVTVIVSEKSAPFSWASKIPSWAKLAKGVPHVTRRKTHFVRQRL